MTISVIYNKPKKRITKEIFILKILKLLLDNNEIDRAGISNKLHFARTTIYDNIRPLIDIGLVKKELVNMRRGRPKVLYKLQSNGEEKEKILLEGIKLELAKHKIPVINSNTLTLNEILEYIKGIQYNYDEDETRGIILRKIINEFDGIEGETN